VLLDILIRNLKLCGTISRTTYITLNTDHYCYSYFKKVENIVYIISILITVRHSTVYFNIIEGHCITTTDHHNPQASQVGCDEYHDIPHLKLNILCAMCTTSEHQYAIIMCPSFPKIMHQCYERCYLKYLGAMLHSCLYNVSVITWRCGVFAENSLIPFYRYRRKIYCA